MAGDGWCDGAYALVGRQGWDRDVGAWVRRYVSFALRGITQPYVCAFIDLPGFIANYNVAHCQEVRGAGEPIDLDYLHALGPSALPAWQRLAKTQGAGELHEAAAERVSSIHDTLRARTADWRAWTWRRARLLETAAPSR